MAMHQITTRLMTIFHNFPSRSKLECSSQSVSFTVFELWIGVTRKIVIWLIVVAPI